MTTDELLAMCNDPNFSDAMIGAAVRTRYLEDIATARRERDELANELEDAYGHIEYAASVLRQYFTRKDDPTDKFVEQRFRLLLDRLETAARIRAGSKQ